MTPKYVYIASPFSIGNTAVNLRISIDAAERILQAGHIPFAPLLSHVWDVVYHHDPEEWYQFDLKWVEKCDCLIRLPGPSRGADLELARAIELNLMVFYSVDNFVYMLGYNT